MHSAVKCLWIAAACALAAGCNPPFGSTPQAAPTPATNTAGEAGYLGKNSVKTDSGESSSAVESALAWSEKYAKVSEELSKAQQQRQELEEANKKLTVQVTKLGADNENTLKDLAEANQMLVELRRELDTWKQNVLGFRDEMRDAQKAQLDALRRLMVFLGAEAPGASKTATQPATSASAPAVH